MQVAALRAVGRRRIRVALAAGGLEERRLVGMQQAARMSLAGLRLYQAPLQPAFQMRSAQDREQRGMDLTVF
jgi:hypothetical protein